MTITKANVSKFGRDKEGTLLDAGVIAEKFIGKTFKPRHIRRANEVLASIKRGIYLRAKYMESLAPAGEGNH